MSALHADYIITFRGQPVAVLRPFETATENVDEILMLAGEVFAGLNDQELAEVETAIRRRPDSL
ncbi:MAG: hypothetical protein H3C34_08315 [Caldilineaceae bacterium]|nr:hypothetical protein [Caldilineaceae bacterium]